MPPVIINSMHRFGAEPTCQACNAGSMVEFNWAYANQDKDAEERARLVHFVPWKSLRVGQLFHCRECQQCWHLDGDGRIMTHVADERLPLVLEWDRERIILPPQMRAELDAIGETPSDTEGYGPEYKVTPCSIETKSGEQFDFAIVCFQKDAPVKSYWEWRLASEIKRLHPSPYALPYDVRVASTLATEARMSFWPFVIYMPDGYRLILNGTANFLKEDGY